MAGYGSRAGGYLLEPEAKDNCSYCRIQDTKTYLSAVSSEFGGRRNSGILLAFVIFNIVAALCLYCAARMPKGEKESASR